jgi:hypothetical protein
MLESSVSLNHAHRADRGKCLIDQSVNLVFVCVLGARTDLTGLSHDLLPQHLAFIARRSGVRAISVHADRLIIGDWTAQPPLDKQSFVGGQLAGPVYGMVRHCAQPA